MKKVMIVTAVSLFFIIGIVTQASARKIQCWDLNENYECDIETEDMNGDGKCNPSDCQGSPSPPSEGAVKVIDAENNFIGYLIGIEPSLIAIPDSLTSNITVYVPSIGKFFRFRITRAPDTVGYNIHYYKYLYYKTSDCTADTDNPAYTLGSFGSNDVELMDDGKMSIIS